jgi:hypothetical protein
MHWYSFIHLLCVLAIDPGTSTCMHMIQSVSTGWIATPSFPGCVALSLTPCVCGRNFRQSWSVGKPGWRRANNEQTGWRRRSRDGRRRSESRRGWVTRNREQTITLIGRSRDGSKQGEQTGRGSNLGAKRFLLQPRPSTDQP